LEFLFCHFLKSKYIFGNIGSHFEKWHQQKPRVRPQEKVILALARVSFKAFSLLESSF